jgi:hypothetical protein
MAADQFQNSDDSNRPPDAARLGEPTPDQPPQTPPPTREADAQPPEPRTRQEHADHAPSRDEGTELEANSARQSAHDSHKAEDVYPNVAQAKEKASGELSTERSADGDQQKRPLHGLPRPDAQRPNLRDSRSDMSEEDDQNSTTDAECEDASTNSGVEYTSSTHDPDDRLEPGAEDRRLDKPLRTEDILPGSNAKDEIAKETTDTVQPTPAPLETLDNKITGTNVDSIQTKDRPHPLTDAEWARHVTEVQNGLAEAERQGLTPERMHTINGAGEIWTDERELLHESILHSFYSEAEAVPCNLKAIIAGGLGGAGKTTVLTEHANIDLSQYLIINPDDFKEEMARRGMIPEIEGLSPMEASDLVHEESSYLALQLALRAQTEGKNVIWDITMSTEKSTEKRINDLRTAGYNQIEGLFVDIPIETSMRRTESRHRQGYEMYRAGEGLGGRYVPPEVIKHQEDTEWGSRNKKTFETLKEKFDEWSTYDNSIDERPATLIDSSRTRHAG